MAKFNDGKTPAAGPPSVITTTGPATTFEGGTGYSRDDKSDLFLLAVTNMVGENTFYEKARDRDDRFVQLIHSVAVTDPAWLYRFVGWLRNSANMRSASIVVAAEAIKARLDAGITEQFYLREMPKGWFGSKDFIPQAMARADEPGEFLAYWTSKYGKKLSQPVRRGLALAVQELFDEYAYTKYGRGDGFQLADIVDLVHPGHKAPWQGDLWMHALNERHKRGAEIPESLRMLHSRKDLMEIPQEDRRAFMANDMAADCFKRAGMTWEALSGWLGGELDAKFWEGMIPSLGYMALLRNLRNFEKAGISREARKAVQGRLADPAQVAKSRQFPYRFLSAYKATESDWWAEALSDALDASVGNLPKFPGRTLVLVDTSGSMGSVVSAKSSVTHAEVGALFGVALAKGGSDVDLHGFAGGYYGWDSSLTRVQFKHDLPKGGSMLRGIESFTDRIGEVGHGTEITKAFKQSYDGHQRVVLVSDMQSFGSYDGDVSTLVPKGVRVFGLNTTGYAPTVVDSSRPNKYEVGGFSDAVFKMIGLIEAGDAGWPF